MTYFGDNASFTAGKVIAAIPRVATGLSLNCSQANGLTVCSASHQSGVLLALSTARPSAVDSAASDRC